MTKPKKTKAVEPLREPNLKEKAAIEGAKEAWEGLPQRPELSVSIDGGTAMLGALHSEKTGPFYQLAQAFASGSNDFVTHQLNALLNVAGKGQEQINSSLAIVAAIAPHNELEAALSVQIAATHSSALAMLMNVNGAKTLPQLTAYGNLATKFQRTMLAAVEALAKLRTGGVQTVRHVHVNEGGQAIIADQFNHYGVQENGKLDNQAHEPFAGGSLAGGTPLPGENASERQPLSAPGTEGA